MTLAGAVIAVLFLPVSPAGAGRPLSPPTSAGAGSGLGVRMMDVPAARVKDPRALAYIVDYLNPGTTIHRRMEVSNTSAVALHVDLYPGAAAVQDNVFTGSDGGPGNDLSSWISTGSKGLDMPPGSRKPVWVTIAVPRNATKGEHYAVVWASTAAAPGDGSGILQVNRVGVRVYLDVGPGGEAPTDFQIDGLAVGQDDGRWPVITAEVHNTGGRAIDMTGSLSMSDADSVVKAGPFAVRTGVTILPGHTAQVTAPVDKPLPPGQWDAQLTLISGTVEHTASATLSLPGGVAGAQPVQVASKTRFVLPIGAGAAVIVVLSLAVVVGRRRLLRTRT